jgi:hypothetical protein
MKEVSTIARRKREPVSTALKHLWESQKIMNSGGEK